MPKSKSFKHAVLQGPSTEM